jgi:hypothetical protein
MEGLILSNDWIGFLVYFNVGLGDYKDKDVIDRGIIVAGITLSDTKLDIVG